MLSLGNALSFSFCKRSFALGIILLFIIIMSVFGLGELIWFMVKHNITPSEKTFEPIALVLYISQTLGYAILFSYLYIRAKQDVYNIPPRFSSEFFIRVCLTFFCLSVLTSTGLYFASPYIRKFLMNSILKVFSSPIFPWKKFIIEFSLPALGCSLLVGYIWSAIYMAYIMHFNFQKFFYKFYKVLTHPLIFLQLIGFSILFLVLTYLPVFAIYWILKTFSRDIMSSIALMSAGVSTSIIPLIIFAVVFGTPIVTICLKTRTGRMITLLFTLLYFMIYGLVWIVCKQMGMPYALSIPVTITIYFYMLFYLFCLIFIMTSIVLPTGLIHLMVQGAFLVHKTFEPTVDKQNQIPAETTQKEDGWM